MKQPAKTESVLETFARAVGASAGIAVHTGSDVADEIASAARRIRDKIAQGADRVKNASAGTTGVRGAEPLGKATVAKPRRAAKPRSSRTSVKK
jgi:hypothetical protein